MVAQSYAEFSLRMHQETARARLPVNGTIELTRRCPLECAHCYNNLPMDDPGARRGDLRLDELRRILDEVTDAGCLWLLLTGGEVLARPDFLQIYSHARDNGLLVSIFTNGTLITPRVADHFVERRPFCVEITLYGRTRETYERVTEIPGSYDRCLRGIRLLKERGIPLKLKTVALTLNRHEIWDMRRFAEEDLGVEFKFDAMVNPRIDCSQSPLAVRLTPSEAVALDLEDPRRTAEWRELAERFCGEARPDDDLYHCGGGMTSFAIDPGGKLSICVLSHVDTFDLRRGSFREGWEGFLRGARGKKITRPTRCTACAIKPLCSMCPANGELDSGDPESPVDYFCEVAHLRARALGIPVPEHGECPCCSGGSGGEGAAGDAVARRAAAGWHPLPVLAEKSEKRAGACGGGCGTCGTA